jgi:spectinomycin phosphotransferase
LEDVEERAIAAAIERAWGTTIEELRYLPVGAGAYHWLARTSEGARWFVTCDDLDTKPWLGDDRDTVFEGLRTAYATALAMRGAGSTFVVAPLATTSGSPLERIDDRFSVAMFDQVDGQPGTWGQPLAADEGKALVDLFATLHRSPPVGPLGGRGFDLPGRHELTDGLADLDRPWSGGPFAEEARAVLRTHAETITGWLAELDRAAARLDRSDTPSVVTHGEPHPGNLIRTADGFALVDWDTVALGRPERDLWMFVASDPSLVDRYEERTGITIEPDALTAHRGLWALADLAAYTGVLRRPHRRDADAERALHALHSITDGREPAPYGVPPPREPDWRR